MYKRSCLSTAVTTPTVKVPGRQKGIRPLGLTPGIPELVKNVDAWPMGTTTVWWWPEGRAVGAGWIEVGKGPGRGRGMGTGTSVIVPTIKIK